MKDYLYSKYGNFCKCTLWRILEGLFCFKKVMFLSRHIQLSIFETILSPSQTVTSWWVLALEVRYFLYYYIFWILKISQLIDIVMGNIFGKCFAWSWGIGHGSRSFIIDQPTRINQKLIIMSLKFLTLSKVCIEMIKND